MALLGALFVAVLAFTFYHMIRSGIRKEEQLENFAIMVVDQGGGGLKGDFGASWQSYYDAYMDYAMDEDETDEDEQVSNAPQPPLATVPQTVEGISAPDSISSDTQADPAVDPRVDPTVDRPPSDPTVDQPVDRPPQADRRDRDTSNDNTVIPTIALPTVMPKAKSPSRSTPPSPSPSIVVSNSPSPSLTTQGPARSPSPSQAPSPQTPSKPPPPPDLKEVDDKPDGDETDTIESKDTIRFIDNGVIRLGFDTEKGAAISHIYAIKDSPNTNLCNNYDQGHLIQQSFYGDVDGSVWQMTTEKRPWRWNVVQGGDYKGTQSKVEAIRQTKSSFSSTTTPCHWVTGELVQACKMMLAVTLVNDAPVAKLNYKFKYQGKISHKSTHQELPALFFWTGLSKLALYTGTSPFTNAPIKHIQPIVRPEPVPDQVDATENWAAYVDDNDWGVGVYFPYTTSLGYYIVKDEGNPEDSNCSYMAPIKDMAITSPFDYEYEVVLIVGNIETIRNTVYELNAKKNS